MRKRLDVLGKNKYDNWVPRKDAVFGWANFDDAINYSTRFNNPGIVQFSIEGDAWCVKNHILEDIYRQYSSEMSNKDLNILIENSETWKGQRTDDLEVWLQTSSVNSIVEITDPHGNPFSLD